MSLCETISASLGVSRRIGRKYRERRIGQQPDQQAQEWNRARTARRSLMPSARAKRKARQRICQAYCGPRPSTGASTMFQILAKRRRMAEQIADFRTQCAALRNDYGVPPGKPEITERQVTKVKFVASFRSPY
ncbi:MAG: hypothetical protein ACK4MV_19695 [Beijerinckiaceae bacterium]